MRNIRLDICYDGTRYRGWQRIPGVDMTIQGKLEQTLSRILEEPVEITGSGRTDAGVHALGQVANFHCVNTMPSDEILVLLRRYLPDDIGIYSCRNVSDRFHARLNAMEKTYRYRIWNSDKPCVFERRFTSKIEEPLNLEKMATAAKFLEGSHDFSAFCANPKMKKSTVRNIYKIIVNRSENEVWITVTGNGFLYHMMRILVGTLVEVGRGERSPETIPQLFGARREQAGFLMPASGLCLMEVTY